MARQPFKAWISVADEVRDRDARGESAEEIGRALKVSLAKVQAILSEEESDDQR